jgi:filamentous hemagglutinin
MAAEIKAGRSATESLAIIKAEMQEIASGNVTIIIDSKGNALIGNWSTTKTLTAPENALKHWTDHSPEFPEYLNASQYIEAAQNFVKTPSAQSLVKTRSNGDVLLYEPSTNTFAVKTSTGEPRTMYRPSPAKHGYPTNLDYFNALK